MTTQLIAKYYGAFNARDYAGMLALLSPDVVHDVNQGGREHGLPAFREFLLRMDAAYREQIEDLVVLIDSSGKRAAAEFIVAGTYLKADPGFPAARGQTYRLPAGAFFAIDAGRIQRVTTYYNLQDWLAQVSKAS